MVPAGEGGLKKAESPSFLCLGQQARRTQPICAGWKYSRKAERHSQHGLMECSSEGLARQNLCLGMVLPQRTQQI